MIDDFVDDLDALMEIIEEEAVERYENDLYVFEATSPSSFEALRTSFAAALCPMLSRVTGKAVSRCDLRAYAYRAGHYLLPHTDHQDGLERRLAYAYYVPSPEPPVGGELELFDGYAHAKYIAPRANRLVVFDVSEISLHQVCEVLEGLRLSLAGWFYP